MIASGSEVLFSFCIVLLTLLLMTVEPVLSKRRVLEITMALFFLVIFVPNLMCELFEVTLEYFRYSQYLKRVCIQIRVG